MSVFGTLVDLAQRPGLSDLHLQDGHPIRYRQSGDLLIQGDNVPQGFVRHLLQAKLTEDEYETFEHEGDIDFSLDLEELRFRVNAFKAMAGDAAVMRLVNAKAPKMEKLGLPDAVRAAIDAHSGLLLVTGATGSGKSTSLAAMIRYLNENKTLNIITVEDPIEFVHSPVKSNIVQRQLGANSSSFARALRGALRQDPDVILVGELRDLETIQLALTAAETGHLVLATLHTSTAPGAITRILDVFPPNQQGQIKTQLAQSLLLVLTQRLLKTKDGGRVGAYEVMVNNGPVANLIRENKVYQIENVMQTSRSDGMQTMDHAVEQLVASGKVDQKEADAHGH